MSQQEQKRMIRDQLDMNREQGLDQTANNMAQEVAMRQLAEEDKEGYWKVITDPDIKRDEDDELGKFIATETTGMLGLGYITREEYEGNLWGIENQFDTIQNELLDKDTGIDEIDAATMWGKARPPGSDEAYRRLRGAQRAAKMMHSGSVEARFLRSGTEIHTVAKSEKISEEDKGGVLSGIKRKLV